MKKKEQTVEAIVKEIMDQATKNYQECEKTGDWETFGNRMKGLYKSYYRVNHTYTQAMLTILQSKPKTKAEMEIVNGNYGFRVWAEKSAEIVKKDAYDIEDVLGKDVAKRYVEGINDCDKYIISEHKKTNEKINKFTDSVVAVLK